MVPESAKDPLLISSPLQGLGGGGPKQSHMQIWGAAQACMSHP